MKNFYGIIRAFAAKKKLSLLFTVLFSALMMHATDWNSIAWLADGAGEGAYANLYKADPAFGQNVINIQKPEFAAEAGIYTNFPAGITSCTLPEGKYVIAGAGMVLYLSAFTAKETAVTVEAGGINYDFKIFYANGTGDVSGGDPDPKPQGGDLTPAKYRGSETVEVSGSPCLFEWLITRNADATLTFEISWKADIVGAVPQICLEGSFITMPSQEKLARFTTTTTYTDGATLNDTFFYMAYAGGAARIEITGYTVGASNENTGFENISAPVKTRKFIENGMLYIERNGVRFNALGSQL